MTESTETTKLAAPVGPDVVFKRDGVDSYGLYVEVVRYSKTNQTLRQHVRLLLAEDTVSWQARDAGAKQGKWYVQAAANHDGARKYLTDKLRSFETSSFGAELRGEPVLLQLTPTDVDQVRRREAPYARYAGTHHLEKKLGKVDDKTWRPSPVTPSAATSTFATAPAPAVGVGV